MIQGVRVRFAPSPTGGLHIGGVRTALYNYLFAKKHGGDFVLRIEDTDQSRFVPGAEQYIYDCLNWCGLKPDESPVQNGGYGPYHQSERKDMYRPYAEKLVKDGYAYYAFDSPEELEEMRVKYKSETNPSPQYDHVLRGKMRNSLRIGDDEVSKLMSEKVPYVIRIKMPVDHTVSFTDMIRGQIDFNTTLVDDKVLLKADGMPTYHLAVVVDDYLMKITHVFRGEEWLPSAPVHLLLWQYLGWENHMPEWAHLPLILGANGKLSKRDAAKHGYPIFAMNWKPTKTGELMEGFREKGFLSEAFINFLALLGWNDGTDQEIYSKDELVEKFSIERVHSGGAKFDYEKAKWFNHEWIRLLPVDVLMPKVKEIFTEKGIIIIDDHLLEKVIALVRDRCTLIPDFYEQAKFFFETPRGFDTEAVKPKWNEASKRFFTELITIYSEATAWKPAELERLFKEKAALTSLKPGELLLPFRIMLVGGKYGPGVFDIAAILGKVETIRRIKNALQVFG